MMFNCTNNHKMCLKISEDELTHLLQFVPQDAGVLQTRPQCSCS